MKYREREVWKLVMEAATATIQTPISQRTQETKETW